MPSHQLNNVCFGRIQLGFDGYEILWVLDSFKVRDGPVCQLFACSFWLKLCWKPYWQWNFAGMLHQILFGNRTFWTASCLLCVNFAVAVSSEHWASNELAVDCFWVLCSSGVFLLDLWDLLYVSTGAWYDTSNKSHSSSCKASGSDCWRWAESRQVVWVRWKRQDTSRVFKVLSHNAVIFSTAVK